jgi:hypothetical protein
MFILHSGGGREASIGNLSVPLKHGTHRFDDQHPCNQIQEARDPVLHIKVFAAFSFQTLILADLISTSFLFGGL